jgi:hypothetical protein
MAAQNITLKRVIQENGTTDVLFPTTHMGQIQVSDSDAQSLADFLEFTYVPIADLGQNSGVATLNSSGKLNASQVPDYLVGGLKLVGTFTRLGAATNPLGLADFITGSYATGDYTISQQLDTFTGLAYGNDDYDDVGQNYIGAYWIATELLTLRDAGTTDEASWQVAVYDDGVVPDNGSSTQPIGVEAGDWLVITGWDNVNKLFKFSIINNTYNNASDERKGVVQLTNATNTGAYNAETNENGLVTGAQEVITEDFLFDNILHGELNSGTDGANQNALKLAASDHIHDGRYYKETEINSWIGGTSTINSAYFTEIKYGSAPSSTIVGTLLIDID